MKTNSIVQCGALALLLVLGRGALAAPPDEPAPWVAEAFAGGGAGSVQVMDDGAMQQVRGRYLQLAYIVGVAAVDLALMDFFWGTYVPALARAGGGSCTSCYFAPIPR